MPETMGSGVVLLDYDNDSDLNIFVTNSSSFDLKKSSNSTPELYENLGNLRFKNVSKQAGFVVSHYRMLRATRGQKSSKPVSSEIKRRPRIREKSKNGLG